MTTRQVLTFAITMLAAVAVHAQGDWAATTRTGEYAFASGRMDLAESSFQQALEIAQTFPPGDKRLETSLQNLGRVYEHRSQFAKAQPLYQLLLAAQEYRVGPDDPELLDTLFVIARVSQPMGDLPTVESCLTRFDAIATASGDADPGQWWQVRVMLARMGLIREDEAAALEWQRRAVDVLATDSNATGEERVVQLESLAQMELKAGEGARAEDLYVQIAALRAAEGDVDATSRTMAAGAEAAYGAGEFDTAERLALRALDADPDAGAEKTARTILADVSWVRVDRGTGDLTVLLAAAGDDEKLTIASQRTQALLTLEGGGDPELLGRLVQIETLRGKPAEAAGWQRRLVESTGGDTTAMRMDLVTLLAAAGLTDDSLVENAIVLSTLEAEYGPSDARLTPVLGQRLNILIDAGRKKDARQVSKRMKKLAK